MAQVIVGAYLDQAAPDHPAGAEWTIHDAFAWLATRGHDCRIASRTGYTQDRIDNVLVYCRPTDEELAQHFMECDVMVTQLQSTMHAQLLAASYQTPLIQYVHSANQIEQLGVVEACSALVVFNSEHVAADCSWWPGDSLVMRPPILDERVRVARGGDTVPGKCTTLINLSNAKGGAVFYKLAQVMEGVPFLGVQGAYGDQALRPDGLMTYNENEPATGLPRNMQVMGAVRDIRTVLAFTRTLLVLSATETYGRVAAEAAISGIPTITVATPGLRECLGHRGVYFVRDDQASLERMVRRSYEHEAWSEWSHAATVQAEANAKRQERELRVFERALRRIQKQQPEMRMA